MKIKPRECLGCGELLPESAFLYYNSQCRACLRAKRKANRERVGAEAMKAKQREYAARYKAKMKALRVNDK